MVNFYLFIYISQGSAWWLQQTAELQPWECQSCPEGTTDLIRGEGEQTHSGKGAKMLISPGSKIVSVKKFNLPNQPLFLHVTQTNIQAFCWKGTWDFCWVQCRVCTELVTPCRFVCVTRFHSIPQWKFCSQADEEVPGSVTQGGQSRAERPNQFLCLSSQHQPPHRYRKALQGATPRCAQNSFLQESQREHSLQLSFLFRTTVLFALKGHRQGSTFVGSDISEPTWYLTKSFSDGDGTFISSKENLLK